MTTQFLHIIDNPANGQDKTAVERLHNYLFANYNKHVQPNGVNNKSIRFGMTLINLDIIEKESIMVTDLWLVFEWIETKFRWNKDDYGGTQNVRVPIDLIWKPDIMLYNK